ncbi:MAG: phosphonate-binding protein [Hyphomicrobiaceae bacterium]|nr:phosphonate-binding protein [Hyphomicrobiaceae bacterium]
MSDDHDEIRLSKGALVAAGSVVLFALVATATARLTGIGLAGAPTAPVAAARALRFEEVPGGSIRVVDDAAGRPVSTLGPDHHGFVRVVMRGFARERMLREVPANAPLRLVVLADGRRLVEDPATGRRIELRAFGAGNAEAFSSLFEIGSTHQ